MRINDGERERWRDNYQNAWAALRMIGETIETLGPPGALRSGEAVVMLYGRSPFVRDMMRPGRDATTLQKQGAVRLPFRVVGDTFVLGRAFVQARMKSRLAEIEADVPGLPR
jgi:hypothetical protein